MNPRMDPTNQNKQLQTPAVVQRLEPISTERPKNLPDFLNTLVKPDTIGGDLCRYFVFPAIEQGVHKALGALLNYFVLGQQIRPTNQKGNGVYIYADNNRPTDYTAFSSGKTSATIIDSNGVQYNYGSNAKYTSAKSAIFKLKHFEESDVLHVNPIPWNQYDCEAKQEHLNDVFVDIMEQSGGWVSTQDLCDTAGIAGAPPTANKWGWNDISQMSVYLNPDDNSEMIINMGRPATQIK